ncbi:formyltransferase family protein [Candidatus Pacebacteria bacterium]|nr:formyltransferase family protein [Candidatus Paceibacterota bacterium]
MTNDLKFAYFAGEPIGVPVLVELEAAGYLPSLVVCNPDRPVGRKQLLTPPPVKVWAEERGIEVWQPQNFTEQGAITEKLARYDLFVVVAYNTIMPKWLIELPEHNTLNVHPSLLPKLRGASPIRTAILEDRRDEIGVTIIQLDEKMDHGPIVAQQALKIAPENWPLAGCQLDQALGQLGGSLLAAVIPSWVAGKIDPLPQDHSAATFCKKLNKADSELEIDPYNLPTGDAAYHALLKIRAYDGWPGTFFMHDGKRIKITDAALINDALQINRIIPEGKQVMRFADYFTQ